MSVYLNIQWEGGGSENIFIAGHAAMDGPWKKLAEEANLEWCPMFAVSFVLERRAFDRSVSTVSETAEDIAGGDSGEGGAEGLVQGIDRPGGDRSRKSRLTFDQIISTGLKSGEYGGR